MAAFVAITLLASITSIAGPLIFVRAVSDISRPTTQLFGYFVLFAAATAASRFLQDAKTVLMNRVQQDVGYVTSDELLGKVMNADGSVFARANAAKISTLVQSFGQSNKVYIQMFMMVILASVSDVAISMAVISRSINPVVAVFVLGYGAATVWLTLRSNKVTDKYLREAQRKTNDNANLLGNVVAAIVSIRIYRGQSWIAAVNRRNYVDARANWNAFYGRRVVYGGLQGLLVMVQYCGAFGALLLLHRGGADLAQILLLILILAQLNRPFELVGTSLRDFAQAKAMAAPVLELFADQPTIVTGGTAANKAPVFTRAPVFDIENLSTRYSSDGPAVLDRLDASFGPGCLNFVVGPSGVGKSTLMNILLRLNTTYTGTVRIDGQTLNTFDDDTYWARVGYVPQEPMMMNVSIRENVLLGREFTDTEIVDTLTKVGLRHKLDEFPDGLDHTIGEGGRLLSGGEKQRLSIARALIARPRILFLDEASSALDSDTEDKILASLRALADDTTIIAITHRTDTITAADNVVDLTPATVISQR
ncbi:ABC transporter ATP-binding protein [Nocardia stercoris]|uniref:ABC transporter ATP-binding protein n=2 Tax=Nocardia stercoris TaxID=2483361 RepID=A0A3M2KS30_9NOCA|nr:ABC transporter ATP-binding protein [Nocardia stercoris]